MTRKSPTDKKDSERASRTDTAMDYMKLKNLLEEFVSRGCVQYNDELDDILKDTAQSGTVRMPWDLFKPLLQFKIEKILNMDAFPSPTVPGGGATAGDGASSDGHMRKQLLQLLNNFRLPPFTVQRLCELVINPCQHYKRKDRFMRALEKNLMVISTHEPDLTWMRIPTLAHLLEATPSDKVASPPVCDVLDKQPAINKKLLDEIVLPHSGSFTFDHPHPATPPPRPATPPPVLVGVKRTISIRDNESVQLQEADSTVADEGGGTIPAVGGVLYNRARLDSLEEADVLKVIMGPLECNTPAAAASSKDQQQLPSDQSKQASSNSSSCSTATDEESMDTE